MALPRSRSSDYHIGAEHRAGHSKPGQARQDRPAIRARRGRDVRRRTRSSDL